MGLSFIKDFMNPQLFTQPMSDYDLDQLSAKDGLLNTIPYLNLDLPDRYIIKTLHMTIEDSVRYYDNINEYNLKNKRLKSAQMLEGKHLQENKLYRHQTPYVDNEIFVGVDAIVAYVTAQAARAEVAPATKTIESRTLAKDLEAYMEYHSDKHNLAKKQEGAVYNLMGKYIGLIKLRWDPLYGENGDIIPEVIDPNHVIIDKNAKLGANPRFICHVLKDTVDGLISRFPDKEKEIMRLFTIKRKGPLNMNAEVAYREVWFTYMEDNKPQEGVAWYVRDLVLDKCKNINWLYEGEGNNFLDHPMKPFIGINIDNDGSNWIDKTSAVEQATPSQEVLNKIGLQVIDNLATANGTKVVSQQAMTQDAVQNWTGDPNQTLMPKLQPGQGIDDVIKFFPPQIISPTALDQIQDLRATIHNILGTPSQFRGDDNDLAKTASTNMMVKNQASGRQDKIIRAIDMAMTNYYNLLAQMMTVWYTDKHYATINSGDGDFDFIEMHKNKIEKGMSVKVQAGTTLPFDKARQEAVAQNAAELGFLSPYDYYDLMHIDDKQKRYDNLMKWKTNPQGLAMDLAADQADRQAIVDFTELMAGDKVKDREDPTPEYIEQMRKLMISDEFLKAKTAIRNAVVKFVEKAAMSLQLRTQLDQMSAPPPPPAPAMPPPGIGQPPAPGGAPMPPQAPPAGSPIQGIMQSPTAPNLNPSVPQPPTGLSSLPPM